jgi:tetratricopeptide (TPR) repeat protein
LIQPDLASRFTAASEPREKLSLAFALANFGQVEADYLISQLDDIEDRDTANLIDALGHDATGSIDKLRQAANECSTLEFQRRKARLALVALALGDTTIPIDACEFEGRPDPGVRTWFIDEFRRWELNRQELAAIVKVSTSPALRSAVCLGLGQIPVKQVSTDDKNRIAELATQWYSLPDSSTHSAVAWLMREWEIPEPTLPDAKQMVDGRNWFVNSQGVTFVRITPKSEEYYSLPDPIEKFRRQFEKLTYLTDADLSGTPKKRLERAYAAYVLEKFDKALADFERLIENNFDLPKTLMYRTLVLARMKKTDEAKKALATWIDKHTKQQSPVSWNFDSWIRVRENTMLTDQGSKEGNRCLKFVAEKQAPDDITFFQKVAVKQNTWYLLSGWIKTENVVVEQTAGMVGANLSLASARWNGLTSDSVLGSSEWTYKTLVFNSKNDDSITVAARLGFNNSTVSGTAWFDDMCLIELPEQTVVNDLNLQKPSFLTAELRKANLIDNPGFEDFTTVPTKADSYHGYLESLVSLWLEDTEGANVALEKALQEVNQLDRDNLFFLACTLARFSEVERLGTERRQASINQSIRLLERWSTGSDADRVSMREHPDLLVLHPIFDFQRLTALRKPTPEHPYWLASREVTRGEYEAFLDDSSYDGEKPRDANVARPDDSVNPTPDHPAQKVSWYDAVMYCNWLSRQEGRTPAYRYAGKEKTKVNNDQEVEVDKWEEVDGVTGYRLPREVEWEYACRAGSETDWSTGSDISLLAVYCEMQSSQASTCGKKLPHAWGMHDMHGNVWEWCWDQFEGSSRVHRGGSWIDVATLCRTANRHWYVPASRTHVIGFRIALSSPSGIPK